MALRVELVAADRQVWSGEASMVSARTPDGSLGVLAGHEPFLSLLADGPVSVVPVDGSRIVAEVSNGFLSVDHDLVTVVAQHVDVSQGRTEDQ
ncbi:F0F1 ATP synthase subunit epsilon [Aquipuribacter nitratireducens]|uniref:F0F1 ATP synthase subunit epsilon n=1 Tax=Aquipuribacter nitratireducens TaxID=650104 RepID=A0ABW0GM07_9MICO